jgi:hypothetical protein
MASDPAALRLLAQEGNASAIATLLNQSFSRQGVRVQAKTVQNTLVIRLQSPTQLDAKTTVSRICRGLQTLQPEGIQRVQVIAQLVDSDTPVWQKSGHLGAASKPQPADQPPIPAASPVPQSSASLPVSGVAAHTLDQPSPPHPTSRVLVGGPQPSGQWLPLWMEWVIANGLLVIVITLLTPSRVRADRVLMLGLLAALPAAYVQTCILARRIPMAWNWGLFTLAGAVPQIGILIQIFGHWWVLRRTADASRWLIAHLVYAVVVFVASATVLGAFAMMQFGLDGGKFLAQLSGVGLVGVTAWALETILAQVPERLSTPESAPIPYLLAALQRPFTPVLPTAARSQPVLTAATAFAAPPVVAATAAFSAPPPAAAAFSAPPPIPEQGAVGAAISGGNISGHIPGDLPQQRTGSRQTRSTGDGTSSYQAQKQLNGLWWRWLLAGLKAVVMPLLLVIVLIFGVQSLFGGQGLLRTEEDVVLFTGFIAVLFALLFSLLLGDAQAKLLRPYLRGWANLWLWCTALGVLIALVLTAIFPVAGPAILQNPYRFYNLGLPLPTFQLLIQVGGFVSVPLGGFILSLLQFLPLWAAQETRSRAWIWVVVNTALFLPATPLAFTGLASPWVLGLTGVGSGLFYLPLSGLVMQFLVLQKR